MNYFGRVISIRADASLHLGTGHVMRCLSLANELRNRGANCHFVCRQQPGNWISEIKGRGYTVHTLNVASARDSGEGSVGYQMLDSEETNAILSKAPADLVVVDNYALAQPWESAVRSGVRRLLVIDDLADRSHDCDLLLDQNFGRAQSDYRHLVPPYCRLVVGSQFALLRPEFARWRDYSLRRRETSGLRQLLISMGGVDLSNVTGQVISALIHCKLPEACKITVLLGRNAPWVDELNVRARQLPWPTRVLVDAIDVAEVMANCDLAVGAGGGTTWERCCLGLPTAIVVIAENQRAAAHALSVANAAEYLGYSSALSNSLPTAIERLASPGRLVEMSAKASSIVDGNGTHRVCQEIGALLAV